MTADYCLRMLHGLKVKSAVNIEGVDIAEIDQPLGALQFDLEIHEVDRLEPAPAKANEILAYDFDNGQAVRAVRRSDGATLVSFSDIGQFRISADKKLIEFATTDISHTPLAHVLLQGWVMSMTLMLRGYVVMHASAVETRGKAIVMLANSGMGKSTITAMLLRDGARLLSDDVLRLEKTQAGDWLAHSGITAVRLRSTAKELASQIVGGTVVPTPDGRVGVRVTQISSRPVPVAAILIPLPSRSSKDLEIKWLDAPVAAAELNQYPRVYDWKISEPIRAQFQATSDLASTVPVGLMSVPWGPPWPRELLTQICDQIPSMRD
ncbi:MAG: hypothetical protein ACR2PZ_13705 [Pseudomonadales bacterium]